MAMEIAIHVDEDDEDLYTIDIGNKTSVETSFVDAYCKWYLKLWVRDITKDYFNTKKKKTLVIGLVPDRGIHYANGIGSWRYNCNKLKPAEYPYDILQLCVGSRCLIVDLGVSGYKMPAKALRDLLSDHRTMVVGIGIEKIVEKLEKDSNLIVGRVMDLRVLAEKKKGLRKCNSLEKLSKEVLGEEWCGVVRPRSMDWWDVDYDDDKLSDDKIRFGTFDAFLTYKIGVTLLKDDMALANV